MALYVVKTKFSYGEETMIMPSTDPDTIFTELLQDLPIDIVEQAIEFKAFARSRKIKSATELLRVVLMFAGLDLTEREVAADLILTNPRLDSLSDQAVHKRLASCQVWLKAILPKLIVREELPSFASGRRIIVVDGTAVAAPGANKASYRLHVAMDLVSLQLVSLQITDSKIGESLKHLIIENGDVFIADRGYARREDVSFVLKAAGQVIVRYNAHNFPVCDLEGKPIDIANRLKRLPPGSQRTLAVAFQNKEGTITPVWVHVLRLSITEAAKARGRCRRSGQQGGYTPRKETLLLSEFIMILTTIPPSELSAEAVLNIYRCRWQVELLIKRWKSLLLLDRLRVRQNSPLGSVYLHGKLLYALLLDRRLRTRCGERWARLDQQRNRTWWRLWKLIRQEIAPLITGVTHWNITDWTAAIEALTERKNNRKLQTIPTTVMMWLQQENLDAISIAQSQIKGTTALAA